MLCEEKHCALGHIFPSVHLWNIVYLIYFSLQSISDHVTLTTRLTCCASTNRMVGWGISQWGSDVNQSKSKLYVRDFLKKQTKKNLYT